MAASVSVIIPALNAEADLTLCLKSLMPGLAADVLKEVIVSDGGSTDQTCRIAESTGAKLVTGASGRGAQLKLGAETARGEWLLFLHADTALSREWPERVADHIEAYPAQAATFELKFRSDDKDARWLERRAMRRARLFGLPYGDQGLLISRRFYDEIGGFKDVPLMEDVIMARAIGKSRLRFLNAEARTSAAKYERDGWRRRARRNAFLLFRFVLGASPETLSKKYT